MKAIIYDGKETISIKEFPKPVPKQGEVLIKVRCTGICGTDIVAWKGGMKRIVEPVILGHEFVGEIEEIASSENSKKLKIGQRVVGEPLLSCMQCDPCRNGNYHVCKNLRVMGFDGHGSHAEYIILPANRVHPIPNDMSWERAALCEPITVGVHMVRRTGLRIGDNVAVIGAGPIGLSVAMVAREAGAKKIVLTEINSYRIQLARELGFFVIEAKHDPVTEIMEIMDGNGADVTFEACGRDETLMTALRVTKIQGTILLGGVFKTYPKIDAQAITLKEQHLIGSRVYTYADFEVSINLLSRMGPDIDKMVTKCLPLSNAIKEGFESIIKGDPVMKVLLKP